MAKQQAMVSLSLKDVKALAEAADDAKGLLQKLQGDGVRGLAGMIRRLDKVVPVVLGAC